MILDTFLVVGATVLASYVVTKGVYRKIDNHATFTKILNEGLYHFTSEENCKKIIESGYVKASDRFDSYSTVKKSFFFAGIPSFENMELNTGLGNEAKLTAIKIKPTFEQLASFKCRELNDDSIVYDGNCNVDDKNVSIAYIVSELDKNGHIQYKEVEKEVYDSYIPSKEFQELTSIAEKNRLMFIVKNFKIDMKQSYQKCIDILNQHLHRMKLIKDNPYSNRPLKEPFNLRESIKQELRNSIEKVRQIAKKQRSTYINSEIDNHVDKTL